jgi:lipopolysaccharide heptosyltransferase II
MMQSWSGVRRLLCIRLDNMGDVLMTTPAIRALRESLPGCRITLLGSASGCAVARHIPEIDDAIEFAAPWMKPASDVPGADAALIAELAARRFDAAVIFTVYSQNPLPAAYLCHLAGVPLRLAYCRENPYRLLTHWQPEAEPGMTVRHEVQRQLALVAAVGCRTANARLSFRVPLEASLKVAALRLKKPFVVVHPGASAPSRRYPADQFAQAMDLLVDANGCEVVFTGDAGERALVESVRRAMRAPTRSLAGRLSLPELGAMVQAADLLVSNNTGPVHLAAALGTPVVDLYALTNPQHTPWQVENRVLFHDVPCRNCYKSVCPQGHHDCLRRVEPERVAAAAGELLRATAAAVP